MSLGKDLIEAFILCNLLLKVLFGLFDANKGSGDLHLDYCFAGRGLLKAGNAALSDGTSRRKRLAELAINIHTLHTIAVVVRICSKALSILAKGGRSTGAVAIEHNVAVQSVLREGEAENRRMFGWGDFHGHAARLLVVFIEGHAVVVRLCDFIFMGKCSATHAGSNTGNRSRVKAAVCHELIGAALASPERSLVADCQMFQRVAIAAQLIVIHLIVAGASNGGPEIKAMRHRGAGADQAAGIARAIVGAAQGIHIV